MRVSVVIPTHNRAHLVGRALRSALSETTPGDEIVVVDDGSTDNTQGTVREISAGEPRIRYIFQAHAGAGAARNRGTKEATGDLLCFLDSDDEWLPGKIALQRRFMESRRDVLFCFTDLVREYGGQRYPRSIQTWHGDPRAWEEITGGQAEKFSSVAKLPEGVQDFRFFAGNIYLGEMKFNYVLTSCLAVRCREAGDAIHFMEGVKTFEDWECFGRLAARGKAAYLDYETAIQYGHNGPRLTDAGLLATAESRLAVLRAVWGSDEAFLAKHGPEYVALVRQQELMRIRGLLVTGRAKEARKAVAEMRENVPFGYRAMAHMPGGLLAGLLQLRRRALGSETQNAVSA